MTTKRSEKTALVAETILFTTDDVVFKDRIDPNLPHNFVDVISLDGSGAPTATATGEYNIFVKTNHSGGFKAIQDGGTLDAALTGGSAQVDGVAIGASFGQNPIEIKIVPSNIAGATSYLVVVTQNKT